LRDESQNNVVKAAKKRCGQKTLRLSSQRSRHSGRAEEGSARAVFRHDKKKSKNSDAASQVWQRALCPL
jgi:hypothetical protein